MIDRTLLSDESLAKFHAELRDSGIGTHQDDDVFINTIRELRDVAAKLCETAVLDVRQNGEGRILKGDSVLVKTDIVHRLRSLLPEVRREQHG